MRSVYSLRTGSRRLSVGTAGVPIGAYTRQILARLRLTSILRTNPVSLDPNVAGIIVEGRASAPPTRASSTSPTRGGRPPHRRSALPKWSQPPVRYEMCVVRRAGADTAGRATPSSQRSDRRTAAGSSSATGSACRRAADPRTAREQAAARGGRRRRPLAPCSRGSSSPSWRCRSSRCSPSSRSATCPDLLRDPFVQDALEVTVRTNAIANALIIGLGTPTAYLLAMRRFPRPRARRHAHRAAARPAAGGRGHRAALGVRRRRPVRARARRTPGSSCRSRSGRWSSRSRSSRRRSTCARRSRRSSPSTRR